MRRSLSAVVFAVLVALVAVPAAAARKPRVLRVGSYHGIRGQFKTIQSAVKAAKPGDWILIGPGDYKTTSSHTPRGVPTTPAAVLITKARLRLRGMNRNTVVIDGTKPGSRRCSSRTADQNFGPASVKGPMGLNGIMVWKANNVWIQNLTACNFLSGKGDARNEIWWNGGDGSGTIGGWGYRGSYLTATSTYFKDESTAAAYGIFSSNWSGGLWSRVYTSNFNDSGLYIGACQQVCDQTIDHAWAEYSALGYSGSNSGGRLVVENSQFDDNEDGFDTNSQNGDNPPPQDGSCPNGEISPITHTHSCWVFMHNYVHDNNNPDVPSAGSAAAGPVGTGMSISGGRNDTVMDNRFERNYAWGVILVPYLDSGPPCTGGTLNEPTSGDCLYDDWGDAVIGNEFGHNGGYGHPSNGDIAWFNWENGHPTPCFRDNVEEGGGTVTTSPTGLQQSHPNCDGTKIQGNANGTFLTEVLCDSQVQLVPNMPPICPNGEYPRRQYIRMHPLPKHLKTMPNPCAGVPRNPWCEARRKHRSK